MTARRPGGWIVRNLVAVGIAAAAAASASLLVAVDHGLGFSLLERAEYSLYDLRFRLRGPREPSGEVVVVAIDSRSVEAIGRWPWTRARHAELVDRLREWGASAVAFDVLFTEPEGTRELGLLRRIEASLPPPGVACGSVRTEVEAALGEVDADRTFREALQRAVDEDTAVPVLCFDLVLDADVSFQDGFARHAADVDLDGLAGCGVTAGRGGAHVRPWSARGVRPPEASLARSCAGLGFANSRFDVDGSLRRALAVVAYQADGSDDPGEGTPVRGAVSLAVAAVAAHLRLARGEVGLDAASGELCLAGLPRRVPLDARGGLLVDFFGPGRSIPTYSFVDVLGDRQTDPTSAGISGRDAFGGKLVFVGYSDPGLGDAFSIPFTSRLPGVEVAATVAENLLSGHLLRTRRDTGVVAILVALCAAALGSLLGVNLGFLRSAGALLVASVGWLLGTQVDFSLHGVVWDATPPLLAAVLGFVGATTYRELTEGRARRRERREASERQAELDRRIEELERARRIQLSMLPRQDLEVHGLEVAGRMRTASEVGGDYYDWIGLDGGSVCLAIGDATGHGVSAGLVVGMVKMGLIGAARARPAGAAVTELARELNATLRSSVAERSLGMALTVALVEPDSLSVEIAAAGMPFPLVVRAEPEAPPERIEVRGPPLGFLSRPSFGSASLRLARGDVLVLVSDGLEERFSSGGEQWGREAMEAALGEICRTGPGAAEIAERLLAACDAFAAGAANDDDMTVLVARVR